MKKYIAIDIGGTAIKYGIVSEAAEIEYKNSIKTEAWKGGPSILEKVIELVEQLCECISEKISGLCISTAGMVDDKSGTIFYASQLIPNYIGTQFKKVLEEKFQIPCEVENDVNCAGLAEYMSGAAQGCKVVTMLTIGTGIGGCLILDGKIFHGSSYSACEVGYMKIDNSDFQTLGAARILTKNVAKEKGESEDIWTGYKIFEEAKKGDMICQKAIENMVDILGKGIANICYIINPGVVVLGGGIMAQEEYLNDMLQKAVKRYLLETIGDNTRIVFAKHKNDAGMLGAFYNFLQKRQ